MSVADRYWSFKLLLQDKQAQEGADHSNDFAASPMPRSLLPTASSQNAAASPSQDGSLLEEYRQFDLTDTIPAPVELERMVEIDDTVQLEKPKPLPRFKQPTQKELNRLSVIELRRLRREIALQVHPDLGNARAVRIDADAMSRCNQLIDAAIKQKLSAKA